MCKSQNPLYRYRLSVSANKEKNISEYYWYRPIQKFNLSVIIGQYEKIIIDRTLGDFPKKPIYLAWMNLE